VGDTITFLDATGGQEIALDPSTNLLVIPTTAIGPARRTIIGVRPDLFLENPMPPNVLLWPEEHFPCSNPPVQPPLQALCPHVPAHESVLAGGGEDSESKLKHTRILPCK
jgi:hypothetical protein